ncbi:MAG: MBL fold metallo-hydrolase [Methanomassiliicoccales archaeon]
MDRNMKIAEHITLIGGSMSNYYDIDVSGSHYLIDAGMSSSVQRIIEYYRKMGSRPEAVLITHSHVDHVGGLYAIYREFSPRIYVPDIEVDVVRGTSKMRPPASLTGRVITSLIKAKPVPQAIPLSEWKGKDIIPVPTPGHTVGSTSYFLESENALFIGDALFNRSGMLIIRKSLAYDYEECLRSERIIMDHPARLLLPGHGATFSK